MAVRTWRRRGVRVQRVLGVALALVLVGAVAADAAPRPKRARHLAATTLGVSANPVQYGTALRLDGTADLPGAVQIQRLASSGQWLSLTHATADVAGRFSVAVSLAETTTLRAVGPDGVASAAVQVDVRPRLSITAAPVGAAFGTTTIAGRVRPAGFVGSVTVAVGDRRVRVRVRHGRFSARVPVPGVGRFGASVASSSASFAPGTVSFVVRGAAPSLALGSHGAAVHNLLVRLRELHVHVPNTGTRYSFAVGEAVLAFRKHEGLARTYTVDQALWRALTKAHPFTPRKSSKGTHIEVDKTRQILEVVTDGEVVGTIAVSTGATGNTPVGTFAIYQKGGSYLYRFMAFHGNFGIHGYVPVPAHPASHGCVREPMWAADWVYRHSRVGEQVVIFP